MSNLPRKFTQPADSDLRQEREELALPFSKSPFIRDDEALAIPSERELEPGELRVKAVYELPWSDLLLEVAMTTTFASLTDGTPILSRSDAISYLSFFLLVWWTWAAQVTYNLRYRQADWLHRVWIFQQFCNFCALAAFTKDFDITNGIASNNSQALAQRLLLDVGGTPSALNAYQFMDQRLPHFNARGISITLASGRILLFVQYAVVFYHARHFKRTSLLVHLGSLAFSTVCYLLAFSILGRNNDVLPSRAVEIAKVVLWYLPVVVEVAAHFIANVLPGHVRYETEPIVARSATVFIVILGTSLDKITSGFQEIVGTVGMGVHGIGVGVFFSAGFIFIITFTLYFGSPGGGIQLGSQRALAWFFAHFFYLSALIIVLQGIATSLSYANLNHAIAIQIEATLPIVGFISSHPGVNVSSGMFPQALLALETVGVSLDSFVNELNAGVNAAVQQNNSVIAINTALQMEMSIIDNILQKFNAEPDPGSLLFAKKLNFLYSNPSNSTAVNLATFADVYNGISISRGSSALWFYGAAGSTILGLALLSLIKGWPRDRWEWGSIMSRLVTGIAVISLSLLSIGGSDPPFNPNLTPSSSTIWRIIQTDQLLPIVAVVMVMLQLTEYILVHLANRSYFSFGGIQFWKKPTPHHSQKGESPSLSRKRTSVDEYA